MIHVFVGHTGEGKSLYLARTAFYNRKRFPDRPIFTVLPLNLPSKLYFIKFLHLEISFFTARFIPHYIKDCAPIHYFDEVDDMFNDSDLSDTWLKVATSAMSGDTRYLATHGPILYIDELPTFFDAQEWKSLPPGIKYFFRQHRKLGFDMYCTSQQVDSIDKSIRELVYAWYEVTKMFKRIHIVNNVRWSVFDSNEREFTFKTFFLGTRFSYRLYNSYELVSKDFTKLPGILPPIFQQARVDTDLVKTKKLIDIITPIVPVKTDSFFLKLNKERLLDKDIDLE